MIQIIGICLALLVFGPAVWALVRLLWHMIIGDVIEEFRQTDRTTSAGSRDGQDGTTNEGKT